MSNSFQFSSKDRDQFIDQCKNKFDLLIIGGGITGAGIALDAISRGLKVALIEKHDYAWGTSGRSTKLIHGGLRYLKQLELKLVKEVGTERAIVHQNARNLVVPEKMLLPIIKKGSLGSFTTSIALWVYDFLAGVRRNERRKMLDKSATKKLEPLVDPKVLLGGGLYYEYRTDDARLTIENIKKAVELGAICINYAEFVKPIYENNQFSGAEILDNITNESFSIHADCVVNATGPWVDLIRKKDNSLKGKRLQLTKGVHIVVPYASFPVKQALYFDVKDGRMVFAIPRQNKTYIGTTDTVYIDEIDSPTANKKDVKYIIKAVNQLFPQVKLKIEDVESSWAGLRPLIHEDGKSPSELSRKDEIFISESSLISIAGGKLTGYRKMAERIVNLVFKQLNKNTPPCQTASIPLFGCEFEKNSDISKLIIDLTSENKHIGLSTKIIKEWVYKYGTETPKIINNYKRFVKNYEDNELCMLLSEFLYCIDNESVIKLEDFFIRRSGFLYFQIKRVEKYLDECAEILQMKLNLSDEAVELQKQVIKSSVADAIAFKSSN